MDVCGIDPGLNITGYGLLRSGGGGLSVVDAGVCRSSASDPLERRLADIEADVAELFTQHSPAVVAVEKLYAHYKHPRTAVVMGHVRGVILAAAARCGIEVRGYNATQIKRYLTGNGRASKRQVQQAVMRELRLATLPEPADVADALAVALCCAGDVFANPERGSDTVSTRTARV
ncbi:MAG: crossover junction endodeoxyribonuclease RuvC [bacterium]|nr:crossover junction endodeoxyribonuclease RuvC [bacterium]